MPRQAVNEFVRQFKRAGPTLDGEGIQALFDCNTFDIWRTACQEYAKDLEKAMGGGGERSYDGILDREDDSDAGIEDAIYLAWERETG